MKNSIAICLLLFLGNGHKIRSQEIKPTLEKNQIYLADPTIFAYKNNYYLYGTTGVRNPKMGDGFMVYSSSDLQKWDGPAGKSNGLALKKGDAFGDKGFWAPQIFEYQNIFYMFYTANEHIALATSKSPLGPFINSQKTELKSNVKQIDPFVFFDDNGKKYLYHVRLENGNRIFVAELNDDLSSIKSETLTECVSAQSGWEDTQNVPWKVAEGPTVVKHKGVYYLFYSANDFRNPDYAVGYATSSSPLGPWIKSTQNPIIDKNKLGINGTGHGDLFADKEGQMYYVLHTHLSDKEVSPRKSAIVKFNFKAIEGLNDEIEIDTQSFHFLKI
nr:glycoside hydrolase family 43 protein [uncultured Flavobacterium sp.]